jgi:hypothetical protein
VYEASAGGLLELALAGAPVDDGQWGRMGFRQVEQDPRLVSPHGLTAGGAPIYDLVQEAVDGDPAAVSLPVCGQAVHAAFSIRAVQVVS